MDRPGGPHLAQTTTRSKEELCEIGETEPLLSQ